MEIQQQRQFGSVGVITFALVGALNHAHAAETATEAAVRLEALKHQLAEQTLQLERLKRALAEQETRLNDVRRAIGLEALAAQRGGASGRAAEQIAQAPAPVGQAPEGDNRPPKVAPIFEQPGVLTPKSKFAFEPSVQYSYSSSNRIALVGYTIIPAILVGVIDVREVKRNTLTGTLTGRYGLTNRMEVEAKLPYVYRHDNTVGREFGAGAANSTVFTAKGHDIGDVELTARYQFNDGGAEKPYYVGSLRFKTRTGKDPFEVETTGTIVGLRGGTQTELPTGSGFYGLQPALTVLYPSDPAVFFGTVSYLHNFKRHNVTLRTDAGPQALGTIAPGGILGFNFGMGLALNEKSSFSIGYDHSAVGKTRQNGQYTAESVWVQLGTLLLGYSHRLNDKQSVNLSLGAGLTRDTPDVTLTLRLPMTF